MPAHFPCLSNREWRDFGRSPSRGEFWLKPLATGIMLPPEHSLVGAQRDIRHADRSLQLYRREEQSDVGRVIVGVKDCLDEKVSGAKYGPPADWQDCLGQGIDVCLLFPLRQTEEVLLLSARELVLNALASCPTSLLHLSRDVRRQWSLIPWLSTEKPHMVEAYIKVCNFRGGRMALGTG